MTLWFDAQTHLLARVTGEEQGSGVVTSAYDDYLTINGVTIPTHIVDGITRNDGSAVEVYGDTRILATEFRVIERSWFDPPVAP
jgi:hypothetical protein